MEFRVLGPLEVWDGGRPVALQRQKHRALLAVLLLRAGAVVAADRLIDELWGGNAPATSREALQNYVSLLRKALGHELLRTRPPGYVLEVDREQVDLGRFERLTAEARDMRSEPEREAKLREALALWRGPPLADLAGEPFAQLEVARLDELRIAAQQDLIDAQLALGRHTELVGELEGLIAENPFHERLRGQLMLALYRSGRQADALEAYRAARRTVVDELGIEPSPHLRELEQAILRQDPKLAPAALGLAHAARKTVTVLFADLVESTTLGEQLDPESLSLLLDRYFGIARAVLERHGATIEKFIGDAVMAVFGLPAVHEDDALRALRAAAEMRAALDVLNDELEREQGLRLGIRIGVNTGEVFAGDAGGRALVTGAAVNLAKRLEQAAPPGAIVIGPTTLALVRDAVRVEPLEPIRLGRERLVPVFRLVELVAGAPALARNLEGALLGRERELEVLRTAYGRALDEERCLVLTIAGDAGIGKTRLANELIASAEGARVLVGRCVSYGEGATYLPVIEMIKAAPHPQDVLAREADAEPVAARLDELLGLAESAGSSGETNWAVRRFFESLARDRPLVLVFEDVHWAEPTLLDLIELLAASSVVAVFVLCLTRPELFDARPAWGEGAVVLSPIADVPCRDLLDALPGGAELPASVRARILETSEGNPLFVEQLLAYVREDAPETASMPPSVEALLAARVDRLEGRERAVLQRAAVAGRDFSRAALAELSGADEAASLDAQLLALARKGLVEEAGAVLRFRHALIREVAYAATPKALRAELHERLGDWLEPQPDSVDELVGYHLEQAYRLRSDLAPADRAVRRLATDAGAKLGAAGIRAWKRGDAPAAVNLLGRATALLPERDAVRLELLCELAGALRAGGETERATASLREAADLSSAAGERRVELRARIELANAHLLSDPEGKAAEVLRLAAEATPVFEALRDDRSLGRTWLIRAFVNGGVHCRNAEREEAAERALVHYLRSGWSPAACLGELASALLYGPKPVTEALARCHALLDDGVADRGGEANVLAYTAGLASLRGDFAEARKLLARARGIYEALGQEGQAAIQCGPLAARVELLAGDYAAAESIGRASCETLDALRAHGHLATEAAELAEILCRLERHSEAARWARVSRRHAATDDVSAQSRRRAVEAKIEACRGRAADAEAHAREAVALAEQTDRLTLRGDVLVDLAEVLSSTNRIDEAAACVDAALRLYELKGATVLADRARSRRLELAQV